MGTEDFQVYLLFLPKAESQSRHGWLRNKVAEDKARAKEQVKKMTSFLQCKCHTVFSRYRILRAHGQKNLNSLCIAYPGYFLCNIMSAAHKFQILGTILTQNGSIYRKMKRRYTMALHELRKRECYKNKR